jgi:hypothetical protein
VNHRVEQINDQQDEHYRECVNRQGHAYLH